jgi:hypothetical protein
MAVEGSTPIAQGGAATAVTGAIRSAAQVTGTSFNYLLATAKIESDLDPSMTMKSSSATGLFQFIEQTWLGTLKQAGPAFGFGDYAGAIERNPSGQYVVRDLRMRREILALRTDPSANAIMAGALTQQNAGALGRRIGRGPTEAELYIAHFFGAGGAGKLINLLRSNPQLAAADVFPQAARANQPIFYDGQGNPRSIAGVYGELVRRYRLARDDSGIGATGVVARATPPARRNPPVTGPPAVSAQVAAAIVPASIPLPAQTGEGRVAAPADLQVTAKFDSLFRDPLRPTAVAPVVTQLWSVPASDAQTEPAAPSPAASGTKGTASASPLDLFHDMRPNARSLFGGGG